MGLASIMVRLGLDASGYQMGMRRAESTAARFGSLVKSHLGAAFSAVAVAAWAKSTISWADKIQDISDDLQISTRTLQEWEYAAEGTRATLDDFTRAFQFLSKQNPTLTNAGVLEKFNALADAFKRGEISLGDLQKEFGRGAAVLSGPFSRGLKEGAEAADRLNRFLSVDQVQALAEVSDAWDRATGYVKAYSAQVIAATVRPKNVWGQAVKVIASAMQESMGNPFRFWAAYASNMAEQRAYNRSLREVSGPPLPPGYMRPGSLREPDATSETQRTSIYRRLSTSANANEQIGAFSAGTPFLYVELKEQTRVLKKIEQTAEKIEDAL